METMKANAAKFTATLSSIDFKKQLMLTAYDDFEVRYPKRLPGMINSGAATIVTESFFREIPMNELPCGQFCQICHEGDCRLYAVTYKNGKLLRLCNTCKNGKLSCGRTESFNMQFIMPPKTSSPLNLIFFPMRTSTGDNVSMENIRTLYAFARTWSGMPHLETHVQWIVEFFGSHCSGLALHSDAVWAIGKPTMNDEDSKEYFQSMRTLLPQIRSVMRIGIDKITFVLSTIASFTVKTSNLEKFIDEALQFGISPEDINFVMYGSSTVADVIFDPIIKTGKDLLKDMKEQIKVKLMPDDVIVYKEKWLRNMHFYCFARMFANGLGANRSCGGAWKNFTNKEIEEARKKYQEEE